MSRVFAASILFLSATAMFAGCFRAKTTKTESLAEGGVSSDDPFDDSDYYTGPPLTEEMIRTAEAKLGYKLPQSYLRLIRIKNGGSLKRSCFPMRAERSAANEYHKLSGIPGIGGEGGIDSETGGSRHLIREWSYPNVGVVIGHTPSAGHDTIMLDYSACGPQGEPRVIHVETEARGGNRVTVLAPDFATFLRGLVDRRQFKD